MTPEQQRDAGISRRQLEDWIARGYVLPVARGSGTPREWPVAETRIALLMGRLIYAGLWPAAAADVARINVTLGGTEVELTPGLTLHIDA